MPHTDQNADNRGKSRCKCCSRHRKPAWKHQDIVKDDVKQIASKRCEHGNGRISVISDKCCDDMVPHKKRCKHQENAGIRKTCIHNIRVTAKRMDYLTGKTCTCQNKYQTDDSAPCQCMEEITFSFFDSFVALYGETNAEPTPIMAPIAKIRL